MLPTTVDVCVPFALGAALGSLNLEPTSLFVDLPAHVLWGAAQQYGLLCLLYRRFFGVLLSRPGLRWARRSRSPFHLLNPLLMGRTLIAGFVSCWLYRRVPNVFALGIAHVAISLVLFSALRVGMTHEPPVAPGYYSV